MKGKGIYVPRPPKLVSPVWTKDPPTKPGLYWFQLRISDDYPPKGVTRHCRVVLFDGKLILHGGEGPVTTRHTIDHFQRWWAGPLLEPEGSGIC